MRRILKIAKLEVSILFYSPVAWLVLTIFMIQCGLSFLDNLQAIQSTLSLGYETRPITGTLFGGTSGLFTVIQSNLYLYLPILTMGLMSREISSGSIKLLLSSPVRLREIIIGKYLAIITYGFTLILVLAVFGAIGAFTVPHADIGRIAAGLFGLYLLICTYAAIGLFMSCLTSYQVVAAISTLAVFAALRFVGSLGQEIDFVRDLTYFLSISGRTDKMIAGLVTSKDVLYYIIIIGTFLSLCVLRLKSERELKPWTVKTGRYAALICGALLLGYVSSRPLLTAYLDVTTAKSLTLTKNGQDIARQVKGELKVTTYGNMLAPQIWNVLPQSRNMDLGQLEQFKRFIPGMNVSYVYYYQKPLDSNYAEYRYNPNLRGITDVNQIAAKMTSLMDVDKNLFLSPNEIQKQADLSSEGYLTVRRLEYNGKSTFIRFYLAMGEQSPYPGEPEFMAAVKRLLVKAPKVIFLTGNNERSAYDVGDRGYRMVSTDKMRRLSLVNNGFDADTVDLSKADIPSDADIVVLADPSVPLSGASQQKVAAYIEKGGSMLINGDPERRNTINPVLKSLGLQLRSGTLVTANRKFTPGFITAMVNNRGSGLDSNLARLARYGAPVALAGSSIVDKISDAGFTVVPVLTSPVDGWNKAAPIDPTAAISYNAGAGDQKGEFPVSVALTRTVNNRQQRILVSGDADFMSNGELNRGKRGQNEYYLQGVFRWLSGGLFPVDATRPDPKDMTLNVSRDQITVLKYICRGIIPAMIAIFGMILLFKRRRN